MPIISAYNYRKANTRKTPNEGPLKAIHIYTFKSIRKRQYIVNIEEYENDIYIKKYHLKNHSWSKKKYTIILNDFDARKVIYTCINIGLEIFESNPKASFGFIGAPTELELKRKKSKRLDNTKRFKVYKNFATFFFDPTKFTHLPNPTYSSYLLLNKKVEIENVDFHKNVITMFSDHFNIDEMFPV